MYQKHGYNAEDIQLITETALRLKETGSVFYTGHCTGSEPYQMMKQIMGDQLHYLHCGDRIHL